MKPNRDPDAWFRQPVLWLGAAIFTASLLGCVAMIVLASQLADPPAPATTALQ